MAEPNDSLSGLPLLLQWALYAGAFVGSIIAIIAGVRAKSKPDDVPAIPTAGRTVEWFMDGPIAKALETFQGIYRELQQQGKDQQRFANERNQKLDALISEQRETNKLLAAINGRLSQMNGSRPRR